MRSGASAIWISSTLVRASDPLPARHRAAGSGSSHREHFIHHLLDAIGWRERILDRCRKPLAPVRVRKLEELDAACRTSGRPPSATRCGSASTASSGTGALDNRRFRWRWLRPVDRGFWLPTAHVPRRGFGARAPRPLHGLRHGSVPGSSATSSLSGFRLGLCSASVITSSSSVQRLGRSGVSRSLTSSSGASVASANSARSLSSVQLQDARSTPRPPCLPRRCGKARPPARGRNSSGAHDRATVPRTRRASGDDATDAGKTTRISSTTSWARSRSPASSKPTIASSSS